MQQYRTRSITQRFWEVLPGLQFWSVFFGAIALSYWRPVWAALFIICFDLYWVLKALNTSTHVFSSYLIFKVVVQLPWFDYVKQLEHRSEFLQFLHKSSHTAHSSTARNFFKREFERLASQSNHDSLAHMPWENVWHVIVFPFVDEAYEILQSSIDSIAKAEYDHNQMILVLAIEERVGKAAEAVAARLQKEYEKDFAQIFITQHPDGLPGEIKGKSANASWAVSVVEPKLQAMGIRVEQVLLSNFDSDTVVHNQYFARTTYSFLTAEKPYQKSYQPISLYNNNIWDSPAFIRVVSVSNSFFQFTESSRIDRLRTFSSHTMTLKALREVGYWRKDIVNEDGFIYWQCYLHYKGEYEVVPLFLPISLDTCLAPTFFETLKNQYKQKRRWAYNVEYYPHIIPQLLKAPIPWRNKGRKLFQYVEGNFNWATASILILFLGWLPLIIGGAAFNNSVLAYNLPVFTSFLMRLATVFLILSVYINMVLLPPRPKQYSIWRSVSMYAQWVLVPITSVVFGSLPAIEAHTRLMLGKYLEFWVTPKARKGVNTGLDMKEMQSKSKL